MLNQCPAISLIVKCKLDISPAFDVYEILDHPIRRLIIGKLHSKPGCSFSELMKTAGENTGSLNLQLSTLAPLISRDEENKYSLNQLGQKV